MSEHEIKMAKVVTEPASYSSRGTYHPDASWFTTPIKHNETGAVSISFDSNPGYAGRRCSISLTKEQVVRMAIDSAGGVPELMKVLADVVAVGIEKAATNRRKNRQLEREKDELEGKLQRYVKERAAGIR